MGFLNPDVVAVITPPWAGNWDLKTDTLCLGSGGEELQHERKHIVRGKV